jgi:nucleotide-binding universal stress UspA family protein
VLRRVAERRIAIGREDPMAARPVPQQCHAAGGDEDDQQPYKEIFHPFSATHRVASRTASVAANTCEAADGFAFGAPGSARLVKLLVVTPEPVDAPLLRSVLGEDVRGAEVLVISPASPRSRLAFWVSDTDEGIAEAERAQEETVERLEEAGVDAAGDTGESEPAVAVEDALATFPADRIVILTHPDSDRDYREGELADAERRFGIPVSYGEITR